LADSRIRQLQTAKKLRLSDTFRTILNSLRALCNYVTSSTEKLAVPSFRTFEVKLLPLHTSKFVVSAKIIKQQMHL